MSVRAVACRVLVGLMTFSAGLRAQDVGSAETAERTALLKGFVSRYQGMASEGGTV